MRILVALYRFSVATMISQSVSIVRSVILIVIVASGTAACSSNQLAPQQSKSQPGYVVKPSSRTVIGERAAAVALQQVGVPYRYGGSTPSGFDCSGLVHYSYASAGKSVPRTTTALWAELAPIQNHDMRVGDLLFFKISGKMSHVGMYLGNGRFVHAPSSGKTVSVESLGSDYYREAFVRAGRPQ